MSQYTLVLAEQVTQFQPEIVSVRNGELARELRERLEGERLRGSNRTEYLWVMSPTSYLTDPPHRMSTAESPTDTQWFLD